MHPHEAYAMLSWYAAMGVDEAIADVALDYRTIGRKREVATHTAPHMAEQPSATLNRAASVAPPISPIAAIAEARALANAATTLEQLHDAIRSFDGCALKKTAMRTVIADGNPNASVMVIGEAPGADEDRQGIPFCGESGQLLDKIFAAVGMTRAESFYITNMIFWRPPGNRNPTVEELAICRPLVEKHIALMQPKLLVLVGGIAAVDLLKSPTGMGITKLRGQMRSYHCPMSQREIPALPMLHPSYLLRQPRQKALAWQDALLLQTFLTSAE